jgi:hypothetical protein
MEQRKPVNLDTQPSADELRTTRETLEQLGAPDDASTPMMPNAVDSTLTPQNATSNDGTNDVDILQSPAAPIRDRPLSDSAGNDPF